MRRYSVWLVVVCALFAWLAPRGGTQELEDDPTPAEIERLLESLVEAASSPENDADDAGRLIDALERSSQLLNDESSVLSKATLPPITNLLDATLRWSELPGLADRARVALESFGDLLFERVLRDPAWHRAATHLHDRGNPGAAVRIWRTVIERSLDSEDLGTGAYRLWFVSSGSRARGRWEVTREALEAMEALAEKAAEPGAKDEVRGFCVRVALNERMRYLLESGETGRAVELIPAYEAAEALAPQSDERIDLLVRVYKLSGNPRAAVEVVRSARENEEPIEPAIQLFELLCEILVARYEKRPTGALVLRARELLSELAPRLPARERLQGAYELFGASIENGDRQAAAEFLDHMEAALRFGSVTVEERGIIAALDGFLSAERGDPPSVLAEKLSALESAYVEVLEARRARETASGGSAVGWFPRELAVFGAFLRLERELDGDSGIVSSMERILEHQTLSALCRRSNVPTCTVDEARRELLRGDDHGILMLQLAPVQTGGCIAFALDRDRIRASRVGSLINWWRSFEALLLDLRSAGEDPRAWQAASDAALDQMLPPSLREMFDSWSKVTIVAFDSESWAPFECLMRDGIPLGATKEMAYLSSLPFGVYMDRRLPFEVPVTRDLLLVAEPTLSEAAREAYPALDSLRVSESDLQSLVAPIAAERTVRFARDDAALEAIAGLEDSFGLTHIFSHGAPRQSNSSTPFSGVILASADPRQTGILYPEDVASLPLTQVALISACCTGQSVPRVLEAGLNNLGGAFLEAGARSVIFAQEELMVRPALTIGAYFTRRLREGASPARAMMDARAEAFRQGIDDPLALGGLRVFGLGHVPIFEPTVVKERRRPTDWRIPITLIVIGIAGVLIVREMRFRSKT